MRETDRTRDANARTRRIVAISRKANGALQELQLQAEAEIAESPRTRNAEPNPEPRTLN
jgi:hypothetical protein